ncbi:hypothetical protein Tco_0877117 [Tanacetum coccineum]|uniref:Uncharacterized protein n=1 Tax=Tanacetum coccineum TaxID=301880 RepID=A0ABQ5BU76_9ASTR
MISRKLNFLHQAPADMYLQSFSNQFLNLSFDTSLIGTLKDIADVEINSLLDVQIQKEIPHIQSPSVLNVHVFVIPEPSILSPIYEIPLVAPTTNLLPPPFVSIISHVLLQTTTPIPTPPINTETPPVIMIPDPLLAIIQRASVWRKILGDALQKVLRKHMEELKQQYSHKVNYKEIIEESVQANVMNEVKNQLPKFLPRQYLTSLLHLDDAIASGQADPEKTLRKIYRDDKDPSAGPNQGKNTKRSRTKESEPLKKSSTSKELSKGKSPTKTSKSGKSVTT